MIRSAGGKPTQKNGRIRPAVGGWGWAGLEGLLPGMGVAKNDRLRGFSIVPTYAPHKPKNKGDKAPGKWHRAKGKGKRRQTHRRTTRQHVGGPTAGASGKTNSRSPGGTTGLTTGHRTPIKRRSIAMRRKTNNYPIRLRRKRALKCETISSMLPFWQAEFCRLNLHRLQFSQCSPRETKNNAYNQEISPRR